MTQTALSTAINDFYRARRRANIEHLLAQLTGRNDQLLSYDEVRKKLRGGNKIERGLHDVPLASIVGSVNRYRDFTRTFLPKEEVSGHRWAGLVVANQEMRGLPPVELYQIGDAYFVLDGNHRVSVARQSGNATIQAYVTEVPVKVPIGADVGFDELIIKEQYVQFLEETDIDSILPDADFSITAPGKYDLLKEHIQVHQYYMGLDFKRDISWNEAAEHWYLTVYQPIIALIREKGMMRDFADRTETDFYIWLAEHRSQLANRIGWELDTVEAVQALSDQVQKPMMRRMSEFLIDAITPDGLESGPPIGQFRRERLEPRSRERLFSHALVAIDGGDRGWNALQQAINIARLDEGQVRGLHIVQESTDVKTIQKGFEDALWYAGIPGRRAFDEGYIARRIISRSRWSDLIVVGLSNPPSQQMLSRFWSGMRILLLKASVPVLAVPGEPSEVKHPLLAFDGSAKGEEALFVAAYMASIWQRPLTVVPYSEEKSGLNRVIDRAESYLAQQGVLAEIIEPTSTPAVSILVTAAERECDLIVMGGYRSSPLAELFLDSPVNEVMRNGLKPIMVVR
ncbi:MAG: universal stress protein [Chloroflexota bacterium]